MINDPYIGMPIIIDGDWNRPCCGCGKPGCGNLVCGDDGPGSGDGQNPGEGQNPGGENPDGGPDAGYPNPYGFDSRYLGSLPLAMAYVPYQQWKTAYSPDKALQAGTVFPELDLPFRGGMRR